MQKLIFLQLLLFPLTINSIFAQNKPSKHQFEVQASGIYQFPTITNTGSPNNTYGGFDAAYGYGLHLNYTCRIYNHLHFQAQFGASEQGRTDHEGKKWEHYLLNAGIGLRYKFNVFQLYTMLIRQNYIGGNDPLIKFIDNSLPLIINKSEIGFNPGILATITPHFSIGASYTKMLTPYHRAPLGRDDFKVFRQNIALSLYYSFK
ncbi:MAG: hypothetical protein RIR11_1356 [Bacteroidota bacterium]|jgi:hypothetical protein